MSNRRKAKRPWLGHGAKKAQAMLDELKGGTQVAGRVPPPGWLGEDEIEIATPKEERVVKKIVPAVIHFKDWDAVEDRDDDEIIGDTVIYEDGTFEMVIKGDISPEAKTIVNYLHGRNPGNFSLAKEE